MTDKTEKCPTCGNTRMEFDPPIEIQIHPERRCGAVKPGNYGASVDVPCCLDRKGHDGPHWDLPWPEMVRWSDEPLPGGAVRVA